MSEMIEQAVMGLLEAAAGKSISPTDVARALAGRDENAWSRQMAPVRTAVVGLARQGRIVILRKGKPANPDAIKGVYRIALPPSV